MEKLIVIIQALLNRLSKAYQEVICLKALVEADNRLIETKEMTHKKDAKLIADLERICESQEYTISCHVKSIQNDIKEIEKLKKENEQLKHMIQSIYEYYGIEEKDLKPWDLIPTE